MAKDKFMFDYDLCGSKYQMGQDIYNGKYIPRYELYVCKGCYDGNWDGWSPLNEKLLVAHLKKKGLPVPKRNEKGGFHEINDFPQPPFLCQFFNLLIMSLTSIPFILNFNLKNLKSQLICQDSSSSNELGTAPI